ncbi:hypothetical protein [Heliophilum fasciatum]|uniref:Uncharacterized protein n=1 Tax=Heliophilum fasciatum TaxID=35700 RepID=A0A4R2RDL9_9FIRM|nr:hypothetical protein [Heliophilum fasciatum]MCW2279311.1 hypothetical protein [Heliophilum fasciatum]TCP60428.1 hypothetical protein EDD73_13810 [Heliophilum fasciatum]
MNERDWKAWGRAILIWPFDYTNHCGLNHWKNAKKCYTENKDASSFLCKILEQGWQKADFGRESSIKNSYELQRYYLNGLHPFLFPLWEGADPLAFHRLFLRKNELYQLKYGDRTYSFRLEEIDLFFNGWGIGFVGFHIAIDQTDLASYLTCLEVMRQLETMYQGQELGKIVVNNNEFPLKEWFLSLIPSEVCHCFEMGKLKQYGYDDRMFIAHYASVEDQGESTKQLKEERDKLIFRFLNIDGTFLSSTNDIFRQHCIEEKVYQRWAPDTYFTIIEYAMGILHFHPKGEESFFAQTILPSQLNGVYYYLYLYLLQQRLTLARLLHYCGEISMERFEGAARKELALNHLDYLRLFSTYQITSQLQGLELWKQWRSELGIPDGEERLKRLFSTINLFPG